MRLDRHRTKLAHGTEDREQPAFTRALSQRFERRQHRLGTGVVSVVDDHDAVRGLALLQPVRHGHVGQRFRSLVETEARKLRDGERSERIARLVAAVEGKVDFDVADAELAPSARGRGVMLAAKVACAQPEACHGRAGHRGQERKERVVRI